MNIIIIGANQVGCNLAENLLSENNDITVIGNDGAQLRELQNNLDLRTVCGIGCHPEVLHTAHAEDADMIIAVSLNDELNILACQIANQLFHTPIKIARIRSPKYLQESALFSEEGLSVDVIISPEKLVTEHVYRLLLQPGALQVLDFAGSAIRLVAIRPYYGGLMVGKTLQELRDHLDGLAVNVAAIYRGEQSIPLTNATTIEIGDEVFFIAERADIRKIMGALRRLDNAHDNILIAGGGSIGAQLAGMLEDNFNVKVIESDLRRAKEISMDLNKATVLHGDTSDRGLLINENIDRMDVFCALTNDDEANIMSCILAKRLGAKHVVALVTKTSYVDIIEGGDIDVVISPQLITISSILTHIRRGDIVNVHSLRRGAAEAIEIIVHGDSETSRVVGKALKSIKFPSGATVGAIVRDGKMIVPDPEILVESEDHMIIFLIDKTRVREIENMFQVKVNFFG